MPKRLRLATLFTIAIAGGASFPAHAQGFITPYLGVNVAGDVEFRRGGPGVSVLYLFRRLGFELDVMRYNHFFKDADVFPRDPGAPPNCGPAVAGQRCTDIDTDALDVMGSVAVPIRFPLVTKWRPYVTTGVGVIRAWTNEEGRNQNNLAVTAGGGVIYALSSRVGLGGDVRYVRAFDDGDQGDGIVSGNYGFLRTSFGVTFRFTR
jgi:opacity protein-like surface antigen